jgi:hypothetical protein
VAWAVRSSALIDNAVYQFGDLTPAADNPSGIDSDGLAGASIYDTTFGPGAQLVDGQTTYDLNNLNVMLAKRRSHRDRHRPRPVHELP